jgi:hypothetical protein
MRYTLLRTCISRDHDSAAPLLFANNVFNANTDPSDFDPMGRYYWSRITVKF